MTQQPSICVRPDRIRRQTGFTLVELLITIGIIVVLISLLIPVVGKIRTSAYEANTRNEVSEIQSACERYYDDFKAYPGPMSNTQIEGQIPPNLDNWSNNIPTATFDDSTGSQGDGTPIKGGTNPINSTAHKMIFTAPENLVLGLLGGLWLNPKTAAFQYVNGPKPSAAAAVAYIPSTLIGTGPRGLGSPGFGSNPNGNKQYTSYLPVSFPGSSMLLNGDQTPEDGRSPYHDFNGRMAGDSIIPVFTDQFPDAMPILYIRARAGAYGVLSGPQKAAAPTTLVKDPTTGSTAYYNYDLNEISPYTELTVPSSGSELSYGSIGVPSSGGIVGVTPPQHGLQGVGAQLYAPTATQSIVQQGASQSPAWNLPVPTNTVDNAGQYMLNLTITPSTTSVPPDNNRYGTPREKDKFILISAGRDRTYGTADDLDNCGGC